jgi:translocation and assembly module TamB
MKKIKHLKKIIFASVVVLMIGILLSGIFTTKGARLAVTLTNHFTSLTLKTKDLQGTLATGLRFETLTLHSSSFTLKANKANFQWDPLSLLHKTVSIKTFSANGVALNIHRKQDEVKREGTLPLAIDIHNIAIQRLTVHTKNDTVSIEKLNGKLSLDKDKNIAAAIQWQNLLLKRNHLLLTGEINLKGTLQHYTIKGKTDASSDFLDQSSLSIEGTGNFKGLSLTKLIMRTFGGSIKGNARLHWAPTFHWSSNLMIQHLHPGKKWAKLTGDINTDLQSNGQFTQKGIIGEIKLNNIKGSYQHLPISGNIHIRHTPNTLNFHESKLALGKNVISVRGNVSKTWNVQWGINIHDLQEAFPAFRGEIVANGKIKGPQKKPLVHFTGKFSNIRLYDLFIQKGSASGTINTKQNSPSSISILATKIIKDSILIKSLKSTLNGTLSQHVIDFSLLSHALTLNGKFQGGIIDETWTGALNTLKLSLKNRSPWTLSKPTSIFASQQHLKLSPSCIVNKDQRSCFEVDVKKNKHFNAKINLKNIDLAFLNLLNKKFETQGKISGNISLAQQNQQFLVHSSFDTSPIHLRLRKTKKSLLIKKMTANVNADRRGLNANLSILLDHASPLNANINLPKFNPLLPVNKQQIIQGNINFTLPDLNFIAVLIPEISKIKGQLITHLKIEGTVSKPKINGKLNLQNGTVSLPALGLNLTNINANLTSTATNSLIIIAKLDSGNTLTTKTTLSLYPSLTLKTELNGQDIMVMNTPEILVTATPNLTIDINPTLTTISGNLTIPKARIKPKDFNSTTTLSEDIVYINASGNPVVTSSYLKRIKINIQTLLGENINFEYAGINTHLSGKLRIQSDPGQIPLGYGKISLNNGSYQAYGQQLEIQKGVFNFNGPIKNPEINISAIRKILQRGLAHGTGLSTLIVGLKIQGTLRSPSISFFSNPPGNSQSDILSYLILGVAQSQASHAEGAILMNALASMSSDGKPNVLAKTQQQLQQTFGLTEFGLQSVEQIDPTTQKTDSNTSLVIGKRLNKHTTVRISQGLLIPISMLYLTFQIDRHWMLQSDASSIGYGADIIYHVERGE